MGGGALAVPGGLRAGGRGEGHEEDHVGAVLVLASALLQIPLHRRKGERLVLLLLVGKCFGNQCFFLLFIS